MFEEIMIMIGFVLFSIVISHVLLFLVPRPLNKFFRALSLFGIVFHEICHVLMCIITNTSIESVKLLEKIKIGKEKTEFKYIYNGHVVIGGKKKLTFLQAVLVSLAPMIFSFWLFFFLWDQLLSPNVNVLFLFLILVVMISIVLSAAPSSADLLCIPPAFKADISHSIYQLFLLILSITTGWIIIVAQELTFFHEIIAYLLIMVIYYFWKYSFKGIRMACKRVFSRGKNQVINKKIKYKHYTRRRRKPPSAKELGIQESPW
ncbi:MAG: hypothetical protein ACTSRI_18110 [Promethearchaeota archaeon]